MGWAERVRRQFWWDLAMLPWRKRVPFLLYLLTHRNRAQNVARFRGGFLAWAFGAKPPKSMQRDVLEGR